MEALNILHNFHFLRPWWLLAMPLWMLLSYGVWKNRRQGSAWSKLCDPALLTYLLGDAAIPAKSGLWMATMILGGALMITALAGPVWQRWPQPVFRAQSGMIIVLDLSRSMLAGDVKPSRLVRARQKVRDILNARTEGQTGLIVFAGSSFDVVPLTNDNRAMTLLLSTLAPDIMPVQGSNASLALKRAGDMFRRGAIRHGSVVMLCDGVDAGAVAAARDLARAGDRVSVLAVGTRQGAPIPDDGGFMKDRHGNIVMPGVNDQRLAAVASAGHGIFRHISIDNRDVKQLPGLIPSSLAHGASAQNMGGQMQTDQWREEGPWLLLLVLPLCALAFRRGVFLLLIMVPFLMPYPAQAMRWQDMWHTRDQQGQTLMRQHHPAAAAARFKHRQWKAAALYRAGKYSEAAKVLDGLKQPDALYNRGNALAHAGDLAGAVAAYNRALKLDASNADARSNLDLVKKLLRKRKKQSGKRQNKQRKTSNGGKKEQNTGSQSAKKQKNHQSPAKQHSASPKQSGHKQTRQEKGKKNTRQTMAGAEGKKQQKKPQRVTQPQRMNKHTGITDAQQKVAAQPRRLNEKRRENENAIKQWLRRIPDDPGGLLRRKFEYQYRNRQQRQTQSGGHQAW